MTRHLAPVGTTVYRTKGDGTPGTVTEVVRAGYVGHKARVRWADGTAELMAFGELRRTPPGTRPYLRLRGGS